MLSYFILILTVSIRFLDRMGFDIPNITEYLQFDILITNKNERVLLRVKPHGYFSKIPFFEDKCEYKVISIKNMQGNNLTYNIDNLTYNIDYNNFLGSFNHCNRSLRFILNSIEYSYKYSFGNYLFSTRIYKPAITNSDGKYTLKVFVINDSKRANKIKEIKKNTEIIMNKVREIYLKSKSKINIRMIGQLSYKSKNENLLDNELFYDNQNINNSFLDENINNQNNNSFLDQNINNSFLDLEKFRNDIEPIRYEPRNLGTPLSRADLVILLKSDKKSDDFEGISYFNGADGLNRSYAVIYTGMNDDMNLNINDIQNINYIALKVAHEIAHSMGVPHDSQNGFIMSKIHKSSDLPVFSQTSLFFIEKYIRNNSDLFEIPESKGVIQSVAQAQKAINSLRKYSFDQIVSMTGHSPETTNMSYYLSISLIGYTIAICVAIYYLK